MNKLMLTPRLQAVGDYVPADCRFADIGTDHAYLPVWLIQQGKIRRAIAADVRKGPLEHAKATAEEYGLTSCFDLRLSDGLAAFTPHEADCIAIAGMGGEAIRSILSAAPWTKEDTRLILQPQSNQPQLRRWLTDWGYTIRQERCIREENRWYSVLLVQGGRDDTVWTGATALVGQPRRWKPGDPWAAFLRYHITRLQKQIAGLSVAAERDTLRLETLRQDIEELEQLRHEWGGKDRPCLQ